MYHARVPFYFVVLLFVVVTVARCGRKISDGIKTTQKTIGGTDANNNITSYRTRSLNIYIYTRKKTYFYPICSALSELCSTFFLSIFRAHLVDFVRVGYNSRKCITANVTKKKRCAHARPRRCRENRYWLAAKLLKSFVRSYRSISGWFLDGFVEIIKNNRKNVRATGNITRKSTEPLTGDVSSVTGVRCPVRARYSGTVLLFSCRRKTATTTNRARVTETTPVAGAWLTAVRLGDAIRRSICPRR